MFKVDPSWPEFNQFCQPFAAWLGWPCRATVKDMGERPQNHEHATGCSECAGCMKVNEGPGCARLWYVVVMHPMSNNVDSFPMAIGYRLWQTWHLGTGMLMDGSQHPLLQAGISQRLTQASGQGLSLGPPSRQHSLQTSPNRESLGLQLRNAKRHLIACLVYKSARRYTAQPPKGKGEPGSLLSLGYFPQLAGTWAITVLHLYTFVYLRLQFGTSKVYLSYPFIIFVLTQVTQMQTSPFWRRKGTSTHKPMNIMNFRAFSPICIIIWPKCSDWKQTTCSRHRWFSLLILIILNCLLDKARRYKVCPLAWNPTERLINWMRS